MRILHVVPSFYPAYVYGGPIESVYQLCRHLVRNGCEVRVLTTDANGPDQTLDVVKDWEIELPDGLRVFYCRRRLLHTVSPQFLRLLPSYIRWADVVHLTAVYDFPTVPALLLCVLLGKPVVWSPRGALQRWRASTHLKLKTAYEWVCRAIAPRRLVLHLTSDQEAEESRKRFPGVKTVVIPNGTEVPRAVTHTNGNGMLRLLYLGRLHPIKGIENLLDACRLLHADLGAAWSLTIAGAGDGHYTESLKQRIEEQALSARVDLAGEVVGEAKQKLLQNTDVVVVPSFAENFGLVVAEALAHGVPVIASRWTPWQRIEEVGCGLWVDNSPESLAGAIVQMGRMPRHAMGQKGREWIAEEFSWDRQAQEMLGCYTALLQRGNSDEEALWAR